MTEAHDHPGGASLPPRPPRWQITVGQHDESRWITYLATIGVITAVVFALIGGFPFDTPMPTHSFGWVEPTCGLTRGSTAIARGDFALAWRYNPAAFLVMGFGLAGVVRTVLGWTTHRWVNVKLRPSPWWMAIVVVLFFALWFYQQQNADFIINSRA